MEKNFGTTLKDFLEVCNLYHTSGTSASYGTYLRAIEHTINNSFKESLLDWIVEAIKTYRSELYIAQKNLKDAENSLKQNNSTSNQSKLDKSEEELETALNNTALERILDKFDTKCTQIKNNKNTQYNTSDCRSALSCFVKYIIGIYKADIYMSLNKLSDDEACEQIAKNALFCKVEIAERVCKGNLGDGKNDFYSWFNCKFQRKGIGQKKGDKLSIQNGQTVILDDNTKANLAIKYAVLAGLPEWIRLSYRDFEDYMACHVWDKTCYDNRYHTSVFNIVLLPKSIGGLTDYNKQVKRLLQYEATMRFGIYPKGQKLVKPKQYDKVSDLWRQPEEHKLAVTRKKNSIKAI